MIIIGGDKQLCRNFVGFKLRKEIRFGFIDRHIAWDRNKIGIHIASYRRLIKSFSCDQRRTGGVVM